MIGNPLRLRTRALISGLVALGLFLAVLGSELYGEITTTRLSLVVLATATLLSSAVVSFRKSVLSPISWYAIVGVVFLIACAVSTFASPWGIWPFISILFLVAIGALVLLDTSVFDLRDELVFVNALLFFGAVYFFVIGIYCYRLGILFSPGYRFRDAADHFSEVGLNRLVNGMVFFGCLGLTVFLDGHAGRSKRALSLMLPAFVVFFSFSAGARQGIISIFLFVILIAPVMLFKAVHGGGAGKVKRLAGSLRRVGGLAFLITLFAVVIPSVVSPDFYQWFLDRFLGTFEHGGSRGDMLRLGAALAALDYGFSNGGLGIGLGGFVRLHGLEAHNGYLGAFAELGVYLAGVCFFVLFLYLVYYLKRLRKVEGLLAVFLMSYLPVHFLFVLAVKDILFDSFTWGLLGMIGLTSSLKRSGKLV